MRCNIINKSTRHPYQAHKGDAGWDVYSCEDYVLQPGERHQFKLGVALEVSDREFILMSERSGMAIKYGVHSIGNIIDSNYRGEISIILLNSGQEPYEIKKGDRIGQLMVMQLGNGNTYLNVGALSKSDRGTDAHYSSGK